MARICQEYPRCLIRKFRKRRWMALPTMVCVAPCNVAFAGTSKLYSPSDGF